jgi:hypothetical protein
MTEPRGSNPRSRNEPFYVGTRVGFTDRTSFPAELDERRQEISGAPLTGASSAATLKIFVLNQPTFEDQNGDSVPRVVNSDEEKEQRGRCDAEEGCANRPPKHDDGLHESHSPRRGHRAAWARQRRLMVR